jgi:hypothetical protein
MAQIMGGYEAIARNVGHPPTTFAFPGGSENEFTQGLVKRTSMIGWRGDWPCVSGASEDLPLEGHLDCIRKAIAREKSWNGAVLDCYVFYMHDVPSDSRLAASLRGMLEFVQARDDAVWCAPYQAVTRYRTEREKTQLNITAKGPSSVTYSLPSMLDPKVYDLPLTTVIQVAVPVAKAWAFRQNDSRPLEVKLREGKIMVNAAPGDGAITVAWSSSKMESLPTVSLSGLETGGKFSMPAPIPLTATVGAGEVPVKSVVFYSGSTRIGEVAKPPFNYTWTTYAPGRHVLTAVAIDALGRRTVSQPAVVACYPKENLPPIATLQKIESRNYQAGQVIEMVVAATDPDDDVARVEYYDGETKIADGGPGALSWFGWNTATVGKHTVTARVYDERGAMTVTAPVTVTITP